MPGSTAYVCVWGDGEEPGGGGPERAVRETEEVKQWRRGMCVIGVLYSPMYNRLGICMSRALAHWGGAGPYLSLGRVS